MSLDTFGSTKPVQAWRAPDVSAGHVCMRACRFVLWNRLQIELQELSFDISWDGVSRARMCKVPQPCHGGTPSRPCTTRPKQNNLSALHMFMMLLQGLGGIGDFFRVGFWGALPAELKGQEFVYRVPLMTHVSDFQTRVLQLVFPLVSDDSKARSQNGSRFNFLLSLPWRESVYVHWQKLCDVRWLTCARA